MIKEIKNNNELKIKHSYSYSIFSFSRKIKSQAEIMGIAIVMVLIMIGIVFVIKFVVLPEKTNTKKAYDQTQLSANFLSTSLKTTTECNGFTMTDLIQDCAANYGKGSYRYRCPDGRDSCSFLNDTMELLLNASLNKMPNVKYDLYICYWDQYNQECGTEEGDIIGEFKKGSCLSGRIEYESQQYPIKTDVGTRVVQMYIC